MARVVRTLKILPTVCLTALMSVGQAASVVPAQADDPALARDLKAYILSLDADKPADCIAFVHKHVTDIILSRFSDASPEAYELRLLKGRHSTACVQRGTLKGIPREEIRKLSDAETANPWWERSGWSTRMKQALLRRTEVELCEEDANSEEKIDATAHLDDLNGTPSALDKGAVSTDAKPLETSEEKNEETLKAVRDVVPKASVEPKPYTTAKTLDEGWVQLN